MSSSPPLFFLFVSRLLGKVCVCLYRWQRLIFGAFGVDSASSLGMMSEEERKMQKIEDIKELLS